MNRMSDTVSWIAFQLSSEKGRWVQGDVLDDVVYRFFGREPTGTNKAEPSPCLESLGTSQLITLIRYDQDWINGLVQATPSLRRLASMSAAAPVERGLLIDARASPGTLATRRGYAPRRGMMLVFLFMPVGRTKRRRCQ